MVLNANIFYQNLSFARARETISFLRKELTHLTIPVDLFPSFKSLNKAPRLIRAVTSAIVVGGFTFGSTFARTLITWSVCSIFLSSTPLHQIWRQDFLKWETLQPCISFVASTPPFSFPFQISSSACKLCFRWREAQPSALDWHSLETF